MNPERKITKWMLIPLLVWLLGIALTAGQWCPVFGSTEPDEFADINSGFFVSKNEVSALRDQVFKAKLEVFLANNGIVTKSAKGLIYYYISEDAISQVEDPEFRERLKAFVNKTLERRTHVVQPGDSLWKIATRYGISVDELLYLNSITVNDPLYPGQVLVISPSGN